MADEGKSKIMKFGAVLFIILMIGSLFVASVALLVNNNPDNPNATNVTNVSSNTTVTVPMSEIPGKDVNFTYSNLKDGVKHLPSGASQVAILNEGNLNSSSLPGANVTKMMVAYYPLGIVSYYSMESKENVSIVVLGNNSSGYQYDVYNNYTMIIANSVPQIVTPGNPILLTSYNVDLAERALDAVDGKNISTEYDFLLSNADNVTDFEFAAALKAPEGSGYEQSYQRTSNFSNGTYQLELMFLNANSSLKQDVNNRALNGSANGVTYKVNDNNSVFKIYVESSNKVSFESEMNNLLTITDKYLESAN
ncbi:hypothetical protein [Methanolapillus millepedarum]|uniref:Uncharacterized protein n=1 Tax=Methanolapillus millepedarum TaxID=3028296 RepID=A0AA96ZVM5_9EURY|nr:hypothetical protein MsAc7_05480 [Methanosarcinaceae archaeon Ac7]